MLAQQLVQRWEQGWAGAQHVQGMQCHGPGHLQVQG